VGQIHPTAAGGFSKAAEAYERGRPGYPPAAIDWLGERLDLRPGATVVDLAAGTGKLTRALLTTGAAVVAVEPVAEMRALIEGAETFDGRADAMPFPEEWADAVTVGQAFHWFANEDALIEIHRVLKPAAGLGLIWNMRDLDDPLQRSIEELIAPLAAVLAERHEYGSWRDVFDRTELFGPLEEASFPTEQLLDADGLVDRFLSMSFVATAPEPAQRELERSLRELAGTGPVRLPYVTRTFVTRRR
jgi:ubiquinone/menaquinone biosynthesis C-methylase UbiE